MQKECKFCKKEIEYNLSQHYANHVSNCKENPLRLKPTIQEYCLNCQKCNKEYKLMLGLVAFTKDKYSKFCCRSCANSRVFSEETLLKKSISQKLYYKNNPRETKVISNCKYCGCENKKCKQPQICKSYQLFNTFIKYFGFDKTVIGSELLYDEVEKVKSLLYKDYIVNELSTLEMQKKYGCVNQRIINTLRFFNISRRTLSDAGKLTFINGKQDRYNLARCKRTNARSKYKCGWHTTWDNKKVYLRSGHEFHYAKLLDSLQTNYEVESLNIFYWDTQQNKKRMAIPDFYLPDTNTIIEIKSSYTLDKQNMIDRVKAFKDLGYCFKLIVNKKESNLDSF